jgi:hypothetical protein
MAGSYSSSRVTVEAFVKEKQVAPVWIGLEPFQVAEYWPAAVLVTKKNICHPARQLARHITQCHHFSRPSRTSILVFRSEPSMATEGALRFLQFGVFASHGTDSDSCDVELISWPAE